MLFRSFFLFFFNDTATTEIYTLSLHDALPIFAGSIFVLSSIPGNDYPSHPEIANVAAHFAEFTLLAFFLARALRQTGVATGTIDTILFAEIGRAHV